MARSRHQDRLVAEMAQSATNRWLNISQKNNPRLAVSLEDVNRLDEIVRGHLTIVYQLAYTRGYRRGKGRA